MGKVIEKIVKKFCVETAVYWGSPVNDGFGGFTFATPVEIKCRWENKSEIDIGWLSTGFPANVLLSKSSVLVTQDLDKLGYLYLGTLADLSGEDTSKPITIEGAHQIHRFDKIPMVFKTNDFVRIAWLYDQGK